MDETFFSSLLNYHCVRQTACVPPMVVVVYDSSHMIDR